MPKKATTPAATQKSAKNSKQQARSQSNTAQQSAQSQTDLDESTQVSENESSQEQSILKPLDGFQGESMKNIPKVAIAIMVAALVAGVGTGYGLNKLQAKSGGGGARLGGRKLEQVPTDTIQAGDVFGSPDESTFKDSAEGYLEIGGVDGEGSHKLLRPGGESQTVYLTSSITDLDEFDGMEVKIWGETFKGQNVGWLMDVGRVEVISVDGEVPTE